MSRVNPGSEQLFKCSDAYACFRCCATPPAPKPGSVPAFAGRPDCSGLAYRTVSALWQARLPLRFWPWPRPQILSVGQLSSGTASAPIPGPGATTAGPGLAAKPSPGVSTPRTDMRHQSRAFASPGGGLKHGVLPGAANQYSGCGASGCQHLGSAPPQHREPAATLSSQAPGL